MMRLTHQRVAASRLLALGALLAVLMAASLMLAEGPAHASTTFTVTNTNDSGTGSLRQAILDANTTTGPDNIAFSIPGSGVETITPDSELPNITDEVSINGYTQAGASANTLKVGDNAVLKIELSGASVPGGYGLRIGAPNSTVKGLIINRWYGGVRMGGNDAKGNKVEGNYIGTDASGTKDLGNLAGGVTLVDAPNNVVGGTTAAARNMIAFNGNGVDIQGVEATGNNVMGNYIGTDPSGTKNLGASGDGVRISAADNTVGGTTAGARNIISASDEGVVIVGSSAKGNRIVGNYIGTDASGTKDLGNDTSGVSIVDASNNTIGGTIAGARNIIAFNGEAGVYVNGQSAAGNRVLSNSIFSTFGLGIDLGGDGPTANDPGDADAGPNNLQNKPRVTSAKTGGDKTTVSARLSSTPNRTFTVQFFSNPAGTDEGKKFLGQKSVTTDSSGNVSFAFSPAQKVGLGRTITATATSPAGNTSEFSAPRTVVAR
jgi:hypothetical protein